jgi:hypothetical protein
MATNEKLALLAECLAEIARLQADTRISDTARRRALADGLVWLMPQAE